jgi:hypothetical protein
MARTMLVERLNVDPGVIEAQLAHGKTGPLGTAYDRAEFMVQRRQMMATWADYLEQLRSGVTKSARTTGRQKMKAEVVVAGTASARHRTASSEAIRKA